MWREYKIWWVGNQKKKVSARDTKMQRKFKQSQNNRDNEIKLLAMLKEEKNSQSFEKKV